MEGKLTRSIPVEIVIDDVACRTRSWKILSLMLPFCSSPINLHHYHQLRWVSQPRRPHMVPRIRRSPKCHLRYRRALLHRGSNQNSLCLPFRHVYNSSSSSNNSKSNNRPHRLQKTSHLNCLPDQQTAYIRHCDLVRCLLYH